MARWICLRSISGLVYTVECGQVSTTHAESARNSKPASLRALDACAPIFTNNDDHDDDNNNDHLIRGRRITMVMINDYVTAFLGRLLPYFPD